MSSTIIKQVTARRIWDSRGRPTIEAEIRLEDGGCGSAIAPAGASTGDHEALELRDGGEKLGGLDVKKALAGIEKELGPGLIEVDAADQRAVDNQLITIDGSANKARLGANATIALSMAAAHAAANQNSMPLWQHCRTMLESPFTDPAAIQMPLPEIQIFGGGAHAGSRIDLQDLMVICPGASSFSEALVWTAEIYRAAGSVMKDRGKLAGVADEGGYWPVFSGNEEAIETLIEAIERAGYTMPDQVAVALDVAASEFGDENGYRLSLEDRQLVPKEMVEWVTSLIRRYPILSVEDPFSEHDPRSFIELTRRVGDDVQIVGDDLFVSDAQRVRNGARDGMANTVLLKPNQRGTLSELLDCWQTARQFGMSGIMSARSGESEDVTIVHLAVGWQVPQLKVGSFSRSERMAKWNEAIRIEERAGDRATFAGRSAIQSGPRPAHGFIG